MTRTKKLTLSVLAFVILLFAFIIVTGHHAKKNTKRDTLLPISVVTKDVIQGPIQESINFTGTLEGREQAEVLSQTAGVVEKILFTPGQNCSIGQVLAVVENSQQEAAVAQGSAQVMAAETNYEKAQKDLKRMETLYNSNVATKDNLEIAQMSVKSAFAQLKGAQAGLKAAQKQLSDTYIKATIQGKVATKLINLGQTVSPGTAIAQLVDDSAFKLKLLVPESNITKIKSNQSVDVTVDVIPGTTFKGRISSVGLAFDDQGTSYPVEITVNRGANKEIKAGMFARCLIGVSQKSDAMLIPREAVTIVDDQAFVYVVNGNKAAKKMIQLGLKGDLNYEVLDGLTYTDKVITIGKEQISDGSSILIGANK